MLDWRRAARGQRRMADAAPLHRAGCRPCVQPLAWPRLAGSRRLVETVFTTGVAFALAGCARACLAASGRGILAVVRGGATLVRIEATGRTTGRNAARAGAAPPGVGVAGGRAASATKAKTASLSGTGAP